MNRAERRRAAAIERRAKQRWARSVRRFGEEALGAFKVEVVRPIQLIASHPELAGSLVWGGYQQARAHPSGPLCMLCPANLTPPTAPGAWLLVTGAAGSNGPGLVTGICKSCAAYSGAELLQRGLDYIRQLWPDLRERSLATLHPVGGRA